MGTRRLRIPNFPDVIARYCFSMLVQHVRSILQSLFCISYKVFLALILGLRKDYNIKIAKSRGNLLLPNALISKAPAPVGCTT